MKTQSYHPNLITTVALFFLASHSAMAWDETGHGIVTEIAVDLLANDSPAFLKSVENRRRLIYLSSEPDRWRNLKLAPIGHVNQPDHYFDIDLLPLYEMSPRTLPKYRYDFIEAMAVYKAAHPEKDFHYDPTKDPEHAHEWPGFAPYRICELYTLLKSSWRTLNTYEKYADLAREGEIDSGRENIIYLMGIMSHYVGDLSQPLHTTRHHHGWEGDNPEGYTTDRAFHQHIDGGVIDDAGITLASCQRHVESRLVLADDTLLFDEVMAYVERTFAEVVPIYRYEKAGAFRKDSAVFGEGTVYIEKRLAAAGIMLEALWTSAYRDAGVDSFREKRFMEARQRAAGSSTSQPTMP